MHKRRRVVLALSCIVVFVTTYVLILPAFTLDADKAAEQGGIDIPESVLEKDDAEDIASDEANIDLPAENNDNAASDKETADAASEETGSDSQAADSDEAASKSDDKVTDKKISKDTAAESLYHAGDGFTVSVDDTSSALPGDTQLVVEELLENPTEGTKAERNAQKEAYKDYCDQAIDAINDGSDKAVKTISFAKLYDISLQSSGDEITPDKPVNVTISYDKDARDDLKVGKASDVHIVHFAQDERTGDIVAELLDDKAVDVTITKSRMAEASFEAESFSVYAIVYTVDFHSGSDGTEYDFSIPGGGFVTLSQLVEALGIAGETSTEDFIDNVQNVEFSAPELMWVGKAEFETTVGQLKEENELDIQYSADISKEELEKVDAKKVDAGDWALISIQPFDSEESLTVTLKNGEQFVINVTDAQNVTDPSSFDGTSNFVIWALGNDGNAYALRTDGRTDRIDSSQIDSLGADYQWKFTYQGNNSGQHRYYIQPASDPSRYLTLTGQFVAGNDLVKPLSNDARTEVFHEEGQSSTWHLRGWGWNNLNLGYTSHAFEGNSQYHTNVNITRQGDYIVLNPLNLNGVLPGNPDSGNVTSSQYKYFTIDGHEIANNSNNNVQKQYSRIHIPVRYNDDGTATITLPSDEQLENFTVSDIDSSHSIVQGDNPNPNITNYRLKLVGWSNIASNPHSYYDTRNGPVEVTVRREDLNVFYADWVAESYDYSYPASELKQDVRSTSDFATIRVWDYDEFYNLTSARPYKVDGNGHNFQPRDSMDSEEWYILQRDEGGQADFVQFVDNTDSGNAWQYGTLGNTQGRNEGNYWSNYSGWGPVFKIAGEIGGSTSSTHVIGDLFSTTDTHPGVNYLGEADYLFSYDPETQVYSYDSQQNGAVYNQSDERFYVSNNPRTYTTNHGPNQKGFLPLNDTTSALSYNNGTINYWFGMQIDLDFWLPDTPGTSGANKVQGQDMFFRFRGDDDVWVFVDGKLVLDIGGIHEALNGSINFSTGEVIVQNGTWGNENQYTTLKNLSELGIGSGSHTLSFYYVERGANESNCNITFNLVPRWVQDPPAVNSAKVTKTWDENTPEYMKSRISFVLKTDDQVVDTVSYNTEGAIISGNTWSYVWKYLDPDKEYVVEEVLDEAFAVEEEDPTVYNTNRDYWAVSSYDANRGFGNSVILIGNGINTANQGGLLDKAGDTVSADIKYNIVTDESISGNDDVRWTVIESQTESEHFYLQNSEGKYLSIVNGSIAFVDSQGLDASLFYMGPTGDLNDGHSNYRLYVDQNGNVVAGTKHEGTHTGEPSPDRVHIYANKTLSTKQYGYEFKNDYKLSPVQFKKVSIEDVGINSPGLSGAVFSLYKERPAQGVVPIMTLTSDEDGYLLADRNMVYSDDNKVITAEAGNKILWIAPGTYYLKEDTAPTGFVLMDDVISFTVSFEKNEGAIVRSLAFTEPELMTAPKFVVSAQETIDGKQTNVLTGLLPNSAGAELPYTGGIGTTFIYILGIMLIGFGSAGLVIKRKRETA